MSLLQDKEYQVLSDVAAPADPSGANHGISDDAQQQQQHADDDSGAKLSSAAVGEEAVQSTLLYWCSPGSPYDLLRFRDLAQAGAPQVGTLLVPTA